MSGVSGPSKRKPAAWMEHGLLVLLQCAEQLHVHVPPDACAIEIDSTPSAVGTVVGTAVVGVGVGAAVPARRLYGPCVLTGLLKGHSVAGVGHGSSSGRGERGAPAKHSGCTYVELPPVACVLKRT